MKKTVFAVLLAIFITGCAPASLKPSETPVHTAIATNVIGAANPTLASSPGTPTLEAVTEADRSLYIPYLKMVDANHGWALAHGKGLPRGAILRTGDGGTTWQDVTPPQLITIRNDAYWFSGDLVGLDADTAWAVAHGGADNKALFTTVWRTDDGGLSWRPGNPFTIYRVDSGMFINGFTADLDFADQKNGWLRARVEAQMGHYFDTWFQTIDEGLTWQRLPFVGCEDYAPCNYFFVDEVTGFKYPPAVFLYMPDETQMSQPWKIEKTTDGGSTWSRVVHPAPADLLTNLFSDQGIEPSQVSQLEMYQDFTRLDSGAIGLHMNFFAYAVADMTQRLFDKDYYFISKDKGQTWQSFPFSDHLFFLTDTIAWRFVEGSGTYLLEKSMDSGVTWNTVGTEISEIGRIQFADEDTGWMIAGANFSNRLMRTFDGGRTWTDITSNLWNALLSNPSIQIPPMASTAVPPEPWIARMEAGSTLVLNAVHMSDANNGWGISLNGYVFHTTDGGKSWRDVTPQYGADSDRQFFAVDALHAWTAIKPLPVCLGSKSLDQCPDYYLKQGPIWYTSDGGQTWRPGGVLPDPERSFETQPIEIRFANESLGWAQWLSRNPNGNGAIYHLYKTSDGGLRWEPFVTEAYQGEVRFLNERIGLRSGQYPISVDTADDLMKGSALPALNRTEDGGRTWNPVRLPNLVVNMEDLHLDQNSLSGFWAHCDYPEISFFGLRGIGVKYLCGLPDVVEFTGYYYSMDEGRSWSNWISDEYLYNTTDLDPGWEGWMQSASEFFLDDGIGWRLYKSGPASLAEIQHTVDGGKSWETVNTVAWQEVAFDFIDEQEGWAIVVKGDDVALVHTLDGGKNWEDMKPIVAGE